MFKLEKVFQNDDSGYILFSNFFFKITLTISLKKKFPIEYRIKAPMEIENTETIVPIICPNNIPEMIKIGEPKPSNATQITENIKK